MFGYSKPLLNTICLADGTILVSDATGILAILLTLLAFIHKGAAHRRIGKFFDIIPPMVLCYFLPTCLSSLHIIPDKSALYDWIKQFVLPASLLLIVLALDVPGILRLGPKAGIMMLAGTLGVMLGGPVALALWNTQLPSDAWRVVSYLAGSWIGGSANGIALQKAFGAADEALSPVILTDTFVGYTWMGLLLFLAARSANLDRWLGADRTALTTLQQRLETCPQNTPRVATLADWLSILALAFGLAWIAHITGQWLVGHAFFAALKERGILDAFGWKVILITAAGVFLSFTPARRLEGAGASRIGSLLLYLLVASIGAGADLRRLWADGAGYYLVLGATWMLIHIVVLFAAARIIHAPFFYVAVASMANIGGAASAPVVAAAFSPALAPVGVLLAIAGYVLGTYCGWLCTHLCRIVVGG